ncbi:hypothetical protein C8J56DRAFT_1051356 [Mycena floridula]|nr:hypothetical protein C8J56DRAFT_1051356 [Mycena floridula]
MPSGPSQIYGPILVVSTLLYGVSLVLRADVRLLQDSKKVSTGSLEPFFAHRLSPRDPYGCDFSFLYLLIAETAHTGFNVALVYEPLIFEFDQTVALAATPLFLRPDGAVTVAISAGPGPAFHGLANQSSHQVYPCCRLNQLTCCRCVRGIATTVSVTLTPNFVQFNEFIAAPSTWLIASAIYSSMILFLSPRSVVFNPSSKTKSGFADMDDYITRIMLTTVQTGGLTAITALADAIVFVFSKNEAKERHWKRWGPYLSDRQWATVREDYSADGDAWNHFPHEAARSRAYRWGEDGLAGISDNHQRVCFGLSLWNGVDPILKERLFGVTGHQGNHGEDVKRLYPYEELVTENQNRNREVSEYEILDTKVFDDDRYWDVFVEKAFIFESRHTTELQNRQLFISFLSSGSPIPGLGLSINQYRPSSPLLFMKIYLASTDHQGRDDLRRGDRPELLFAEYNTRLYGGQNESPHVKDAFHDHIIPFHRPGQTEEEEALLRLCIRPRTASRFGEPPEEGPCMPFPHDQAYVNPDKTGTKSAAHHVFCDTGDATLVDDNLFDEEPDARRQDTDEFYDSLVFGPISNDLRQIMRQALGGMLWTKQYYQFIQKDWIHGDSGVRTTGPSTRAQEYPEQGALLSFSFLQSAEAFCQEWRHLHIADVLSMPDKWEYPFFVAWGLAFHCIPLAVVDPAFAKNQLDVMTREWSMKPDGQIPAYEWNFSDNNSPIHAWATFRIFKLENFMGQKILGFLSGGSIGKTRAGTMFSRGFLGLNNIGVFNRFEPLPTGGHLHQTDGIAWMAFYCLNMLNMALELAKHNPVYEDIASKCSEHFCWITDAMTYKECDDGIILSDLRLSTYYDTIDFGDANSMQLPIRSLVDLIPFYGTMMVLEPAMLNRFTGFKKRRPEVSARNMASMEVHGKAQRRLLAVTNKERLVKNLEKIFERSFERIWDSIVLEEAQGPTRTSLGIWMSTGSDMRSAVGSDVEGCRATNGGDPKLDHNPHFRDYFFHADNGRGLGVSHQTGWSGLAAFHILQSEMNCRPPKTPSPLF